MLRRALRAPVATALAVPALAFVLAALAVVLAAVPADAHAKVMSTRPANGAQLTSAPATVSVSFDDPVTLLPHALTVTTDQGVAVALDPARVRGGTLLSASLQDQLGPGGYVVAWRIEADDGHEESGTFSFTIAGAAAGPARHAAAVPAPPGAPRWPAIAALAVAVVAGLGAAYVVRRGLRALAAGDPYPLPANDESPTADAASQQGS